MIIKHHVGLRRRENSSHLSVDVINNYLGAQLAPPSRKVVRLDEHVRQLEESELGRCWRTDFI